MCGICGFWSWPAKVSADETARTLGAMARLIAHRGPDDDQAWFDTDVGIGLGFRRLAILDLSPLGRQPMVSNCGRWVIVFNGEIYNFQDLRAELEAKGSSFRGHSDTEVLLAAVSQWGPVEALRRANGMLALALWDRQERELWLARDRLGKKPLYYGMGGRTLLFGSELKALTAHPAFNRQVDRDALGRYLQYGWVPGPSTIWQDVRKLPAGCYVRIGKDRVGEPQAYWSAWDAAARGAANPFQGSFADAVDSLETLLRDAVGRRMVADVPLGAFLSGGIDSSAVVALMQAQSPQPVKTFAIGFNEERYNEAPYAAAVAKHLGTDHTELYVSADDGLNAIPELAEIWDEPFADPSQIPTLAVSRLARERVTVCLSGDGADELFGGYSSYRSVMRKWNKISRKTLSARQADAKRKRAMSALGWRILSLIGGNAMLGEKLGGWATKQEERARYLDATDPLQLFAEKRERWDHPGLALGAKPIGNPLSDPRLRLSLPHPQESMMHLDAQTYLVDDVLVKVDRASMAVSLEMRAPLLDWRVAEFAFHLPLDYRIEPCGVGKRVLRGVLDRYVPKHLFDRPKSGFSVPIAQWLRGPLRDWAEDLLDPSRLAREGYLDAEAVGQVWRRHVSGWANFEYLLWSILMFQVWQQRWLTAQNETLANQERIPRVASAPAQ
jgi:asparagine synthase (glutamine-hydrolysing)